MHPHRTATVALLGNPNTGKTTLFNALSGLNQRVGNYPGVTVETRKGRFCYAGASIEVIDLPGTYSLAPRSPDEMLAVNLILGIENPCSRPDVVVIIVDASNLDRNLYLMTQVVELGLPVVLALNMTDIAQKQGIVIDERALANKLGVPVVPIQANKGKGLDNLKRAILESTGISPSHRQVTFPEPFNQEVANLERRLDNTIPSFLLRRLLLDIGGPMERLLTRQIGNGIADEVRAARDRLSEANCGVPGVEARSRYAWIREATRDCVRRPPQRPTTWTDRLDPILTHKVWGMLFFLGVMFLVFESIFVWAKPLMEWIDEGKSLLQNFMRDAMDPGPLRSLLVDGVIAGVGGVLVFLPQIMILFAFIAVLEDCGYMARAAYLMDKLMARCGLNGKSFIPLLSSVACAVPGIMATRVIENRRDRLATILVAPLMSCSARLPVYLLLTGAFLSPARGFAWWVPGLTLFGMYSIGLIVAPLVALMLKRTLLRGETPLFVMEMPLYKAPSARIVWRRMIDSGWMFTRRAGTLILASMVLVWALLYFPNGPAYDRAVAEVAERLDRTPSDESLESELRSKQAEWKQRSFLGRMGKAIEPMVKPLGWDWRIGMAALASFPAREVFVGTMGIIYGQGEGDAKDEGFRATLGDVLQKSTWDDDPGQAVFSVPVVVSVMVFFALCCQCASTLAVIRRETMSWFWPVFAFVYMSILAYLGALAAYQLGNLVS
jgi:ferrous iron transport protein B